MVTCNKTLHGTFTTVGAQILFVEWLPIKRNFMTQEKLQSKSFITFHITDKPAKELKFQRKHVCALCSLIEISHNEILG